MPLDSLEFRISLQRLLAALIVVLVRRRDFSIPSCWKSVSTQANLRLGEFCPPLLLRSG